MKEIKLYIIFILILLLSNTVRGQDLAGLKHLDSLKNIIQADTLIKNSEEVARLKLAYEILENKNQVALLQKDNELMRATAQKQILIIVVAVTLIIFLTILIIILYLSNSKAQKLNQLLAKQRNELEDKNEEIRQQKEEIEAINNNLEQTVVQRTQQLQFTVGNLSHRNQDLEQFSYIVSHNLRAPIAHLIGLANVFNKENIADPMNHEILAHVQKSAYNLDMIVKDLTHILSIRNDLTLKKDNINLQELTDKVLEDLQADIEVANPKILYDFSKAQGIYSVKPYIENMLYQLLSNAIKYRKKRIPLQIQIASEIKDCMFVISVKDNGLGIDLSKIDPYKVFGLYQRMHTHVDGKGLGLYLVKTQVEALGGKVNLESEENIGSTFKLFLPI
ncbi:MAG: HAMP domain-containing histidine kinase [Thermoflexibacter sp.]|nr:HAMP domain-containing histidine kinase [Thermoflexibacter sp.]